MKNLLYNFLFIGFALLLFSCSSDDSNAQVELPEISEPLKPFELVLQENVTDNEVAALITEGIENGMNSLVVSNTTNLTTLNLSQIQKLDSLKITNNEKLENVSFPNLETTVKRIEVIKNNALSSIDFPKLTGVDYTSISGNEVLKSIIFPVLTEINNQISIQSNTYLTTISFGTLSIAQGDISIGSSPNIS